MGRLTYDVVRIGKTKYKYVSKFIKGGETIFFGASILGKGAHFDTEKEAAIYVDTQLILAGKKPVNILKKV
jgi:hypothetical protein